MATLSELFPNVLKERSLRFEAGQTSHGSILLEESGRLIQEKTAATDKLLIEMGETVFQLRRIQEDYQQLESPAPHIADALEILKANLEETLENNKVRLLDFTNQELTAEMRSQVEIRAQQTNPEVNVRTVTFMEFPVVYRGKNMIAPGIVTIDVPENSDGQES